MESLGFYLDKDEANIQLASLPVEKFLELMRPVVEEFAGPVTPE